MGFNPLRTMDGRIVWFESLRQIRILINHALFLFFFVVLCFFQDLSVTLAAQLIMGFYTNKQHFSFWLR